MVLRRKGFYFWPLGGILEKVLPRGKASAIADFGKRGGNLRKEKKKSYSLSARKLLPRHSRGRVLYLWGKGADSNPGGGKKGYSKRGRCPSYLSFLREGKRHLQRGECTNFSLYLLGKKINHQKEKNPSSQKRRDISLNNTLIRGGGDCQALREERGSTLIFRESLRVRKGKRCL